MTPRFVVQNQVPPDEPAYPWFVLDTQTGQPCTLDGQVWRFPAEWVAQSFAWWQEQRGKSPEKSDS